MRTTAGSLRTSKRDEISTWSEPRVTTCAARGRAEVGGQERDREGGREGERLNETHQGQETVARERHDVRLEDGRVKAEHLGVHVERRERPRRDDDAREALKDWGDGE